MIREYILSVIGTVFVCTACEYIMPNGNMKKYFRLATGFIVMCTLISPLAFSKGLPTFEFSFDGGMSESEIRAESDAYILKLHEATIKDYILEVCGDETEVFLEIYSDGTVKSVALKGDNIQIETISALKNKLGCENITIINR